MPSSHTPTPDARHRRVVTAAAWRAVPLLLGALAGACVVLWPGRGPRLRPLPEGAAVPVLGSGTAYSVIGGAARGCDTVWARPVGGGEPRLVVREPGGRLLPDSLTPVGSDLWYVVERYNRNAVAGMVYGGGGPIVPWFAAPPHGRRRSVGDVASLMRVAGPTGIDMRVRSVPVRGGRPRDLLVPQNAASLTLSGRAAYWLRPRADEIWSVSHRGRRRYEIRGHTEMWFAALPGGRPTAIARGLPASLRLVPVGDGVCWTMPRPYPDLEVDLYVARGSSVRRAVSGFRGQSVAAAVQSGDALYWLAGDAAGRPRGWSQESGGFAGERLMECRGGRTRELLALRPRNRRLASGLVSDGRRLYCVVAERFPPAEGRPASQPFLTYVWQLDPARGDPVVTEAKVDIAARHILVDGSVPYMPAEDASGGASGLRRAGDYVRRLCLLRVPMPE